MKRPAFVALVAALLAAPAAADTLFDYVNGVQVDAAGHIEHFNAMLIGDDGKVVRLIHPGETRPKAAHVVNEQGRTVLPGFIDAHGHVIELGVDALQLQLVGTSSLAELQQRLHNYAAAHPDAKWILGAGWNQELWPDKKFPTAADLDAVVSDRPVVLTRVDGHALVANSAAMRAAGVTAQTPAPPGGRIENGLFVDNAKELINKAVPAPSPAELDQAFAKAQDILLGFGVTSVGSMSTALGDWEAMRRAGDAGRLSVRFTVYADELNLLKVVPQPTAWLYGDRLRMVGIKFYADGALGSRGAWLKRPYADMPNSRGLQFHSDAELRSLYDTAASHGFQIATHAIGDAANAQVISGYEWLNTKYGTNRRWRVEHAQIVDCADLPRIGRAHIIASMQPTHQTSDRLMAEKRLDPARLKCAYAWQSMLRTGAKLAFGTDFPVESPNPFPGLSAAISRQDVNGQPPGGWYPAERVTLGEALDAYTRGAAYAGFAEDRLGSLDPGKWADFVVVDRDPTQINPQELARTQVLETWIAGNKVWERAPSASRTERGK
ncbi:MAG TPA: amidohydrolase family protein [Croceibacterium sp.]|jgi:predicted amidohydrolase YtcJ|nr:amidohydrolase family protein [Croceibacterium sp.]